MLLIYPIGSALVGNKLSTHRHYAFQEM